MKQNIKTFLKEYCLLGGLILGFSFWLSACDGGKSNSGTDVDHGTAGLTYTLTLSRDVAWFNTDLQFVQANIFDITAGEKARGELETVENDPIPMSGHGSLIGRVGQQVGAMDLVEVNVIRPKPIQAVFDLAQDRLARQPGAIRPFPHFAVHLGGDHNFVALGEVLQSASEVLLTRSKGIDVGGIEEIDAQLEGFLDDRPAVFLVKHPFVKPTLGVTEAHAAQTDA